jgi:hypothetical protein
MAKLQKPIAYSLYELDRAFKNSDVSNINKYVEEAQNFFNGNHYPNKNFKNSIRVTLNICKLCAEIKASKVCGTPIYLTYTADNNDVDCSALRRFDEYNCSKLGLDTTNYESAINGFVNGTEIVFIRWDEDDTTYKGIYKGGLAEEHIDIRNFAVANPYVADIQNQEWVMFWEDYPLKTVKDMVEGSKEEKEAKIELLEREVGYEDGDYKDKDKINHALVRMFTRFFRIDGEVYFECSTREVQLFKYPHPISKRLNKNIIKKVVDEYNKRIENLESENESTIEDYDIDAEDSPLISGDTSSFSDNEYKNIKEKFSLYPFAVFVPYKRNRSFYGNSDIKSLIPIQKGINFALSMLLKCIENNAYNKIFVKDGALGNQVITNEAGQVIVDHSNFSNTWGIKFAESQPMPNGLIQLVSELLGMTRVVYGFNEVMNGDVTNKDMSGYMLQQMIKQSNTTIEQQQKIFWKFNVDKASIRLLYYKHFVNEAKYTYELEDGVYEEENRARQILQRRAMAGQNLTVPEAKPEQFATLHKTRVESIKGKDLWGVNFDVAIDATQGVSDGKLVEQQMFDNLLLNGGINNISPEILNLYLQASPNVSARTKTALKQVIKNLEQSKIRELEQQLMQLA